MSALAKIVERFTPEATRRRIGPIGLECALHAMHMVQLESGRDGRVVVRARASYPYACPLEDLLASPSRMKAMVQSANSVPSAVSTTRA